jgi:plasmid stabilization system protein ParE
MSSRQIDVHPEAVAEARAADAFLAELDRAVERITENPEMYPHYVRVRVAISCSASPSIWYTAKLAEKLISLLLPMVDVGPDIGKNV